MAAAGRRVPGARARSDSRARARAPTDDRSSAKPEGRLYTANEIARWVARAHAAGVVLVPEVDMPAHMHAALAALPQLRDPYDRSRARSVQGFVDNVLVPGHPETDPFVDAVLDALCTLFPSSPWIHVGGDEVASGAWTGSPIAAKFAAGQCAAETDAIAAAFMLDVVQRVRQRGRKVVAWQELAESGAIDPDDGFVLRWQSVRSARGLAERRFDVIVAPGSAYYLDMVTDDRWESRGRAGQDLCLSSVSPTSNRDADGPSTRSSTSSESRRACGPSTSATEPRSSACSSRASTSSRTGRGPADDLRSSHPDHPARVRVSQERLRG